MMDCHLSWWHQPQLLAITTVLHHHHHQQQQQQQQQRHLGILQLPSWVRLFCDQPALMTIIMTMMMKLVWSPSFRRQQHRSVMGLPLALNNATTPSPATTKLLSNRFSPLPPVIPHAPRIPIVMSMMMITGKIRWRSKCTAAAWRHQLPQTLSRQLCTRRESKLVWSHGQTSHCRQETCWVMRRKIRHWSTSAALMGNSKILQTLISKGCS